MIKLLEFIFSLLFGVHNRIYQERLPEKDPATGKAPYFPYVVFSLRIVDSSDGRNDCILDIDIWDNKPSDTTRVESMGDDIEGALNMARPNNSYFQASFYKISRIPVPDPDKSIRRRRLSYQVKVYFK